MRFGSTGDPLRWYISQPAKCGPLTSQFWRLPSAVRTNAPFFVPTETRILLMVVWLFPGCSYSWDRYVDWFTRGQVAPRPGLLRQWGIRPRRAGLRPPRHAPDPDTPGRWPPPHPGSLPATGSNRQLPPSIRQTG